MLGDARRLEALQQDPAWQRLRDVLAENEESYHLDLAKRLAKGEAIRPEEVAFYRGFYLGAKWLLDMPDKALDNLETAAKRAWKKSAEDYYNEQAQKEELSPYA